MTAGARDGRSFAADPIVEAPSELPPVWAAQLVSCVVDENVGLPDAAVLTFRDPDHEFLKKTGITTTGTTAAGTRTIRYKLRTASAPEMAKNNVPSNSRLYRKPLMAVI